jgi:hypothetical protein
VIGEDLNVIVLNQLEQSAKVAHAEPEVQGTCQRSGARSALTRVALWFPDRKRECRSTRGHERRGVPSACMLRPVARSTDPPRPRRRLLALLFLVVTGCPGKKAAQDFAPKPCARFGDSCEFSPGKLGSCVERTGCSGPNCLICQSQH